MSIEGEVVIDRPIEEVFDYVADERHEPTFNRRMLRVEQLTPGPIGKGTRFLAATRSMGRTVEMTIEFTQFDRPARLASTTRMSSADTRGALTFTADPAGTRMRWSWDVEPKGAARVLAPLINWMGSRQEQVIWSSLKRHLEATSGSSSA